MNDTPIPSTVTIASPAPETLRRGATAALDLVREFEISDTPTYDLAAEELRGIKERAARLDEQRKAITKPLDAAKAAVMDLFRGPLELLQEAEALLKRKMLDYSTEQARKAAEERAAAERAAKAERERLEREAAEFAAQGRAGEAAVKTQVAEMIVASPVVVAEAPKAAGISTRETVAFEVVDLLALVQHVAQHPELIGLLVADSTKLRAYVRGLGLQCNLPGVRVFTQQSLAARKG